MARVLSQLLDAEEPLFTIAVNQLEKISGHPSADVRLIADISAKVHQKINELALDPDDTTAKELYHALQGLTGLHDQYLANAIGTSANADLVEQLVCIRETITKLPIARSCWTMKHSVAKKLLKNLPPKKLMNRLGYKSIDSMLKREHISEIFAAVRFMETRSWQDKLVKSYRKLTPSDFEIRDIEVLMLDSVKWGNAADALIYKQHHNITHLKELGVIMILPIPVRRLRGLVITVLPLAIHYVNEIRSYSAFLKLQQVTPKFGEVLVRTILQDPKSNVRIGNQELHWRVLQRHFGTSRIQPELFEPHVQAEDLAWRKAEDILFHLEPALKFWQDLDYVATYTASSPIPVSFNLMDNAVSYCNKLDFGQHSVGHFRESLWNEIFMRYLGQDSVEQSVLQQLDEQVTVQDFNLESEI